MGLQFKATNGDSFILVCWTSKTVKKDPNKWFQEKVFSVHIKDDHLFIVDNGWNSIAVKPYRYSRKKSGDYQWLGTLEKKAMGAKARKLDGICIDLNDNEECKSLKPTK